MGLLYSVLPLLSIHIIDDKLAGIDSCFFIFVANIIGYLKRGDLILLMVMVYLFCFFIM